MAAAAGALDAAPSLGDALQAASGSCRRVGHTMTGRARTRESQDPPSVGSNDPVPRQKRHTSGLPDVDFIGLPRRYVKCPMLPSDERVTLLRPHEIAA